MRSAFLMGGGVIIIVVATYAVAFYPRQSMPVGSEVSVTTPKWYKNDCLHPCVRLSNTGGYYLSFSPYYSWDSQYENPFLFHSEDLFNWYDGFEIANTPQKGYNSDPNIIVDKDRVFYCWRECYTPLCDSLHCFQTIVGGYIGGNQIDKKRVLTTNTWNNGDYSQSPIIINKHNKFLLYAAWYQYNPVRRGKGIAIWESNSLDVPNFHIVDTIEFGNCYTVDKIIQFKMGDNLLFLPRHKKYDLWHFDLFEYRGKLWMVSVAEKEDNIMLSVSEDYKHFKTFFVPLINNHCSERHTRYRQYYYKPTAFVRRDSLFLFYTANSKEDPNRNQLFLSVCPMSNIL